MDAVDLALILLALAGAVLRALGLLLAGRMQPDHPFVRWAGAVALATLAAFVAAAVFTTAGAVPLLARGAGIAAALAWLGWRGGLLAPLLAGFGVAAFVMFAMATSGRLGG